MPLYILYKPLRYGLTVVTELSRGFPGDDCAVINVLEELLINKHAIVRKCHIQDVLHLILGDEDGVFKGYREEQMVRLEF